jgi:multiple sugar transport system substrate-binding protein
VSVEDGAKTIGEKMEAVLAEAGYYDGKKPMAQ